MNARAKRFHTAIVLCALLPCQSLWAYGGGTGTRMDPYLIYTAAEMNEIGLNPEDWDKHFKLMADIDLAAYAPNHFNLIGLYRPAQDPNEELEAPFSGVFDGHGHTIANFTYEVHGVADSDQGWVNGFGLFRLIDGPNARIKDLTLRGPNLYPSSTCRQRVGSVGALAGIVKSGLITGCRVEDGHIRGDRNAGGLVGSVSRDRIDGALGPRPILLHCSTNCGVSRARERSCVETQLANQSLHSGYGGMAGFNYGLISDCEAAGRVSGAWNAGGLVGTNWGEIMHCYATGAISGESSIGGLAGESNHGLITSSWASGDVTGIKEGAPEDPPSGASLIGGLVGSGLYDTISDCHASGHVTGRGSIGGLTGGCGGSTIEHCYALGPVSAENQLAGGLVGETGHTTVISQCYACAKVSAPEKGGGLVGLNGGTIQMSWAAGEVSGDSTLGGLVGANWKWQMEYPGFLLQYEGAISDSYALTAVICREAYGGGLVGFNRGGTIVRCFAAGEITGDHKVGGLMGAESWSHLSQVEQSFWDTEATGLTLSDKGCALTTRQMQDRATFIDAGWDLAHESENGVNDIWRLDADTAMYPQLTWQANLNMCLIHDTNEDCDESAASL